MSNYEFMRAIATFLGSSFKEVRVNTKYPQYRVRTITLASNIKLESYLEKYPLFGSKYLNYKDWLKVLEFKKIPPGPQGPGGPRGGKKKNYFFC